MAPFADLLRSSVAAHGDNGERILETGDKETLYSSINSMKTYKSMLSLYLVSGMLYDTHYIIAVLRHLAFKTEAAVCLMSVCLPTFRPVCPTVRPSVRPSVRASVCLAYPSVCLCLSLYLFAKVTRRWTGMGTAY